MPLGQIDSHDRSISFCSSDEVRGRIAEIFVDADAADDARFAIIEINARFGGGFPLSWEAGAAMPYISTRNQRAIVTLRESTGNPELRIGGGDRSRTGE